VLRDVRRGVFPSGFFFNVDVPSNPSENKVRIHVQLCMYLSIYPPIYLCICVCALVHCKARFFRRALISFQGFKVTKLGTSKLATNWVAVSPYSRVLSEGPSHKENAIGMQPAQLGKAAAAVVSL
jgi:hypothetical protein